MILSDKSVLAAIAAGDIVVDPFDRGRLGPNSYDVTLGRNMLVMKRNRKFDEAHECTWRCSNYSNVCGFDAAQEPETKLIAVNDGRWLFPGRLYLGVINEYTACSPKYVPMIDGTSSAGRLGLSIHVTAGRGDAGYSGHFTLEMHVVEPLKIYRDMPVGQIWWMRVDGEVEHPYGERPGSNYQAVGREEDPLPKPSAMWKKIKRNEP